MMILAPVSYTHLKIAFNSGLENEGLYIFLPTFLEDLRTVSYTHLMQKKDRGDR